MAQELLVNEQIDAGVDFVRDFNDYVSVAAAFWIRPAESDEWFLYVASDDIDDTNFDVAYGEVFRRLRSNRRRGLDPFRVKLVNSSDPVARDAIDIRDRYPADIPTRYSGPTLGEISIEGAYIYPPLPAMKSTP
jgi:hypothetical protein